MLKCSAIALTWNGPDVFSHSFLTSSSDIWVFNAVEDFLAAYSIFCLFLYSSPLDDFRWGKPMLTLKLRLGSLSSLAISKERKISILITLITKNLYHRRYHLPSNRCLSVLATSGAFPLNSRTGCTSKGCIHNSLLLASFIWLINWDILKMNLKRL